jgi:hypothetical protein
VIPLSGAYCIWIMEFFSIQICIWCLERGTFEFQWLLKLNSNQLKILNLTHFENLCGNHDLLKQNKAVGFMTTHNHKVWNSENILVPLFIKNGESLLWPQSSNLILDKLCFTAGLWSKRLSFIKDLTLLKKWEKSFDESCVQISGNISKTCW